MLTMIEIKSGHKPEGNCLYFGCTPGKDFYVKAWGSRVDKYDCDEFINEVRGVFRRKEFKKAEMPTDRMFDRDSSWRK